MKIHELSTKAGQSRRRDGRGIAAGRGKTAGRGTKGQGARAGSSIRPGFEGGQNPLMHRIPKHRGFKSLSSKAQVVHTDQLNQFEGTITAVDLHKAGLISDVSRPVRVLTRGEVSRQLRLVGIEASGPAAAAIAKAGGSLEVKKRPTKPAKDKS